MNLWHQKINNKGKKLTYNDIFRGKIISILSKIKVEAGNIEIDMSRLIKKE